jgi:hypothetical protein
LSVWTIADSCVLAAPIREQAAKTAKAHFTRSLEESAIGARLKALDRFAPKVKCAQSPGTIDKSPTLLYHSGALP